LQERQKLIDKIKIIDERIETRAIIFTSLIKGILISDNSDNKKSTPTNKQTQKLIQGGDDMKYRGVSIHKNKNCNTWYTRCTINGKQVYISAKTQQDCYNKLKLAFKKKTQMELKGLREPKPKEPKAITFSEWYNKWLELYKNNVKESTKRAYKSLLNYLKALDNKAINKITSIDILEILNKITYERQKQKVYELLNDIFNKAKINKIVNDNPVEIIQKPKHKKVNGIALSNEDEAKFEKILIDEKLDIFLVCLYQGLRKGEVMAITNEDIDYKQKTLTINKAINSRNELDTTKNCYSNRVIPLFDKTLNVLEKYKNINGRIFNYTYKQVTTLFENIIKNNFNGKKYTPHSLRHTFITRCQEANIPLHIVQKWVGHNIGSKVTNAVYTHAREHAELENIEKINVYMNL